MGGGEDDEVQSPGVAHTGPARQARVGPAAAGPDTADSRTGPVGFQNSATGLDQAFYAARSYSPPRTSRRLIRFWERSATGWSGRGGQNWRLQWAGANFYDGQAIQAAEGNRAVHVKEIGGEHRRGLGMQELPPGRVSVPLWVPEGSSVP